MVCDFTPMSRIGSNCLGADGIRVEKISRIHYFADSRRDPKKMNETQCELEQFQGRIIFMSMYSDIVGRQEGNEQCALRIRKLYQMMREDSRTDIGRFLGLD